MNRRNFTYLGLLLCASPDLLSDIVRIDNPEDHYLMTVNGKLPALKAGFIFSHEHILVDFIGADKISADRYQRNDVVKKALPFLKKLSTYGGNMLIEATPSWLGRDVRLLQQLSKASGLHIMTNTGYYGASAEKFVPEHAYKQTAEQLAESWILEWKNGIDGTDIKPGFIKTGLDNYPLSTMQQKLVEAAALTHTETGLTIGVHTGDGKAALKELEILQRMHVNPEAWIWIHAQSEKDRAIHLEIAKEGGWISFDGLRDDNVLDYVQFLVDMKKAALLSKVLISHDAGWYHVGEPDGGNFRGYETIFLSLLPAMKKAGFTEKEIELIFKVNPAKAFAVKART